MTQMPAVAIKLGLLIWLGLPMGAYGQDTLVWRRGRPLVWTDFEGKPPVGGQFLSAASVGLSWAYRFEGDVLRFTAHTYFHKATSWRKGGATQEMLVHEQGHFDIGEIFTRGLRYKVAMANIAKATAKDSLAHWVLQAQASRDAMQHRYDADTRHGTRMGPQREWLGFIQSSLDSLAAWR